MTIREKMKAGHLYTDLGEGLDEERERCKELTYDYNLTRPREAERRKRLAEATARQLRKLHLDRTTGAHGLWQARPHRRWILRQFQSGAR